MIEPNSKLGRYEIRSLIGAGGMGEVYLARDPKIGRDVAIKVLPSALSDDKERLARFEQEAQAAGALNHPNILAIYDVATDNGSLYVVSELLEGETLRDMIGGTPLAVRKALNFGLQTAHGLAAAHEKGIIHRDLKPENLFITVDGRLKILDFGLAKLVESNGDQAKSDLPTRKVNTNAGAIMGTIGYMSPEQLRGKPVDQRTDIFSFGTVLYEMLSGQKAFQKDSTADTIGAILREDPPELSSTNKNVDAGLERIVHRCLEKNREERFHSASDLAFALESLSGSNLDTSVIGTSSIEIANRRSSSLNRLAFVVAGLFLLSTAVFAFLYLRRADPPAQAFRFSIYPPEKVTLAESGAISPDGKKVAYVGQDASGNAMLFVRSMDSFESSPLAGTEGASFPFWSPDSRSIGFFANSKLKKVEASGGASQILADASADPRGGAWSSDGTILFAPTTTGGLFKVSSSGGPAVEFTKPDGSQQQSSHRWPKFLPDGKHFLYFGRTISTGTDEGVFVASTDSLESKLVLKTYVKADFVPSADGSAAGTLLFILDGNLMAQRLDTSKYELTGDAVPVAQNVISFPGEVGPTAYGSFSVSPSGTLIYRVGDAQSTQLTWFDRTGKNVEKITEPGIYHEPLLSPDGNKVLFTEHQGDGDDQYILDMVRTSKTRLTFDGRRNVSSVFSPDGSQIIFATAKSGAKLELYLKAANGAGSDQLLLGGDETKFPDSWSRDGKYLIYEVDNGAANKFDLFILPMTGDHVPFSYLNSPFQETHAQFSPDGHWIAYCSNEQGRSDVYVQSFPLGGGKWQISLNGGDQPQWRKDGQELYYMAPDRSIMAVKVNTESTFGVGKPTQLFLTNVPFTNMTDDRFSYLPTPDGQRFLVNQLAETNTAQPWYVVLNWANDLK
jgi:serine/threonine protein kinase